MNLAIWYIIITTIPHSAITYPKPVGPFTQAECIKGRSAVLEMGWSEIAAVECRKAVRFYTCATPDMPYTTCCCPIFGTR